MSIFFDLADYLFELPIDFAQKLFYHIVLGKACDIIKSRAYKLNWRLALNLALTLRFGINLRFFIKKMLKETPRTVFSYLGSTYGHEI